MRSKNPLLYIGFILYVVYISRPALAVTTCAELGGFCCKDNKGCNGDGCWCDNMCISYKDCCIDYNQTCLGNFNDQKLNR